MSVLGRLFGKGEKKQSQASSAPQPAVRYPPVSMTTLGEDPDTGIRHGIPTAERTHCLAIGGTGTGKTIFLLSLILQDLRSGAGFAVIDAHGDLVSKVLPHIPRERWKDVVYINPLTAFDEGRVVQLNFLEPMKGISEALVDRAFMSSLQKIYEKYWGPRLEEIMGNVLKALREAEPEHVNVHTLSQFLSDPDYKTKVLKLVQDQEVRRFWYYTYRDMPDYASTAVQTKIYRILQEPVLEPMFSRQRSTVDFRQLMDERKIVIINLPEGHLTYEITNFLGTILLSRIYLAGMSREGVPEDERVPFNVYVDESARFMTSTLCDLLQSLRKYRVAVTLSVQDLLQYDRDLREAVPGQCSTLCVFASGERTARMLEGYFTHAKLNYLNLMETPYHWFRARSVYHEIPHFKTLRTCLPPAGEENAKELISASLECYGAPYTPRRRGIPQLASPRVFPELDPIVFFALVTFGTAHLRGKTELVESQFCKEFEDMWGFKETAARSALRRVIHSQFVDGTPLHKDAAGHDTKVAYYHYSLARAAWLTLYPPLRGPRAGGALHTLLLAKVIRDSWKEGMFPVHTTGTIEDRHVTIRYGGSMRDYEVVWPDLIVYPPVYTIRGDRTIYDAHHWDNPRRFAVEVEADPARHPQRTVLHYESSKDMQMPVVFVVKSQEDRECVEATLRKHTDAKLVGSVLDNPSPGAVEIRVYAPEIDSDEHLQAQVREGWKIAKEQPEAAEVAGAKAEPVPKIKIEPLAEPERGPPALELPSELKKAIAKVDRIMDAGGNISFRGGWVWSDDKRVCEHAPEIEEHVLARQRMIDKEKLATKKKKYPVPETRAVQPSEKQPTTAGESEAQSKKERELQEWEARRAREKRLAEEYEKLESESKGEVQPSEKPVQPAVSPVSPEKKVSRPKGKRAGRQAGRTPEELEQLRKKIVALKAKGCRFRRVGKYLFYRERKSHSDKSLGRYDECVKKILKEMGINL